MEKLNLNDYKRGWIIGNFSPTILPANFEIGIKKYKKGDKEAKHYHKYCTEITVILSGIVKMNNNIFRTDDIIVIEKNESTDFECLEDCITVVIKDKSDANDKFMS